MRRHSWERISQLFKISWILKISLWSKCLTSLRNWWVNKMKSMVWTIFIGERINGDNCHWLVMKQLSIISAQKSMSSQILCCTSGGSFNIQIPTKFYMARIGRLDILWSVNKFARSVTKWTRVCDKRLFRLISLIHHTCEYKQYCHVGKTVKQCRLGLFQDVDFAGDLEDSKSISGGALCVFGSHSFVPISWMCKKQTSVSHSSTESEIISLDTGLRLDWLPVLELWDLIVSIFGNISRVSDGSGKLVADVDKREKSQSRIDVIRDIDLVPSNVQSARQEALLYVFEDNEVVIKTIINGRSPTMRHVSRIHRVALDWLFDRINLDSQIQIKSTPKTNSQTCWPEGISHAMNGIICWHSFVYH